MCSCCSVQCAVFVYFLGTGKAVKTAVELRGLDDELARETRSLKGKTFPFATFAALAVVLGAVLAGAAAPTTHAIAMVVALGFTLLAIPFELRSIRRNHDLMNRTDTALERKESDLVASGARSRIPTPRRRRSSSGDCWWWRGLRLVGIRLPRRRHARAPGALALVRRRIVGIDRDRNPNDARESARAAA